MLYQRTLPVLAGTLITAPAEKTIIIKHPVISRLIAHFPAGCHSLVKVAIFYGNYQLWPAPEGEWLKGDDINIEDEPYFELPERETELRFLGISSDTAKNHSPIFYITAVYLENVSPTRELIKVVDLLEEYLTAIGVR